MSLATTGQFEGCYVHYSSLAETHHPHFVSHSYHGLSISWVGLFWGERQHGSPSLPVHKHPPL